MNCYQYKGGSGTASRLVTYAGTSSVVGVFVQANFGSRHELVISGVPVGIELADDNPMGGAPSAPSGAGSVIALVATDAPLLPNQCKALARRMTAGLARTGTSGSHYSGDLFLAFSTGNANAFRRYAAVEQETARPYDSLAFVPWRYLDPFFEAVVQGVEESVLNAIVANEEMVGRQGHRSPCLPRERVRQLLIERRATTQ